MRIVSISNLNWLHTEIKLGTDLSNFSWLPFHFSCLAVLAACRTAWGHLRVVSKWWKWFKTSRMLSLSFFKFFFACMRVWWKRKNKNGTNQSDSSKCYRPSYMTCKCRWFQNQIFLYISGEKKNSASEFWHSLISKSDYLGCVNYCQEPSVFSYFIRALQL
jgi:hypothetical protein